MRLWKTTARRFVATQGVIPRDSVERLRGRGLAFLPGPGPSCVGQGSWPGSNRRQRRAASSSARSRSTVINAFRSPLSASILSRHRRVTSTGRKRAGAVARADLLNRRKQDRLVTHRPASGPRDRHSASLRADRVRPAFGPPQGEATPIAPRGAPGPRRARSRQAAPASARPPHQPPGRDV